jgi:glycine dehydrogenase subunit 1
MRYLPQTEAEVRAMLDAVGADSLDDLFGVIPQQARRRAELALPEAMTEWELEAAMCGMADCMGRGVQSWVGAGSYEHHIPSSVQYLASRSEFVTSYTPYQPEISQGTLQAIFEYQTLTARLLGMEASNASMYDGASALAESMLMAVRVTKRKKVAVSRAVHPHHRQVAEAYFHPTEYELVDLPFGQDGRTDWSAAAGDDSLAGIVIQSPNFFGCIEDLAGAADTVHGAGGLLVASFTEPLAFGLLKNPGVLGADIACGDGQSMGLARSFGGPGLGMLAVKMKYIRNIPGRLVGQTVDLEGRRGYVLTLATREQHIRREKAVSNICTNASHCALTAAMHMASLGKTGLKELARLNRDKAEYLKDRLTYAGLSSPFAAPTFNEFVVRAPEGFAETRKRLMDRGVVAGLDLSVYFPDLSGHYLFCATETKSKQDIDQLVKEISR